MNVFVLCTGRCGSTTFIRACEHITNYTAEHESRRHNIGEARFQFPQNHIEADNRLAWFLGRLDDFYGNDAFYVHLIRDKEATAASYAKRHTKGIIDAYRNGFLMSCPSYIKPIDVCRDCYDTVNSNIECFLKDKTNKMVFRLENAKQDFEIFYNMIDAKGNLEKALGEWEVQHNASASPKKKRNRTFSERILREIKRTYNKLTYRIKGI